jgi:hypothetical protein
LNTLAAQMMQNVILPFSHRGFWRQMLMSSSVNAKPVKPLSQSRTAWPHQRLTFNRRRKMTPENWGNELGHIWLFAH